MKTYAGGLKRSEFIRYQDTIWQLNKVEFYSPGKGSALTLCKAKNVQSGKTIDITFKSNEDVETVEVSSVEMVYSYKDAENMYFMNEQTYEQIPVPVAMAEDFIRYIKEGDKLYVYLHDDTALSVRPPLSVRLKVTECEDAVKGGTVSNVKKQAVVETGAIVMVPLFVKQGEIITINPDTGEYTGRS